MHRLTDELAKDKEAWESADWKMNDMIETWWDKMTGEDQYMHDRKARFDHLEKSTKTKLMATVADARRSLAKHQEMSTKAHVTHVSKAIGKNRLDYEHKQADKDVDERFTVLESEWMKRKEEMQKTREKLSLVEVDRVAR
jgi:hypothetical protein